LPPPNWTKATETELRGITGWKGQGRKGREGTGIKEGEGGSRDGGSFVVHHGKGVEK